MSDLSLEIRESVRSYRGDVEAFRASKWASTRPDALAASDAVLMLADGASVADVAHRTGQPEWRIRLWAGRLATDGIEAVEAGYRPERADSADGAIFVVGLLIDCPLRVTDVVEWARGSWISQNLGVDANETVAWLAWPECSYSVGITSSEPRISHLVTYYIRDVPIPPVGDVRALFSEVVGDELHPDSINRGIELWGFLDSQPGATIRGRDGKLSLGS